MNLTPIQRRPETLPEEWHVACLPHSDKKNGQEQQFKTLTRDNNTLTTHLNIPGNNEMGIVRVHAQLTTETKERPESQSMELAISQVVVRRFYGVDRIINDLPWPGGYAKVGFPDWR